MRGPRTRSVAPRRGRYDSPMSSLRGLLIDIDGVLTVSWKPLPGAVEALATIRAAGIPVCFLTNTTSRTRAQITRALQDIGFEVDIDEVVTVAAATAAHIEHWHPGARCLLLNSGDVTRDLSTVRLVEPGTPARDVDIVILGGAGPEYDYDTLNHVLDCLLSGATLLAMHRNLAWRTDGGLQLDIGAFLPGLERAADVTATIIGKPEPAMFAEGLTNLGLPADQVAMIGDDLDTDVRGAQAAGIVGAQVRTGKFRTSQLYRGAPPDALLESFASVPGWLGIDGS